MIRTSAFGLVSIFVLACSGGGGANPDGGSPTGDGGAPACTATATATILVPTFTGISPSIADQDVYYIDPNQGAAVGNIKSGVIRHIKVDGTGDSVLYTPTARPIFAAAAAGADVFFFQLEEDTGMGAPTHLYKVPRAGGAPTQIGTYDFTSLNIVAEQIDLASTEFRHGVFDRNGDDIFVNEGNAISRVAVSSGTRTVIADAGMNSPLFYPNLRGSNVFYVDSKMNLYKTSAMASAPSGMQLGTQTCGSTTIMWASSSDNGWICGSIWGFDAIDATGTTKTRFFDTKPVDSVYNPSRVDGTTFYGFGSSSGSANPIRALLKMDVRMPNAATPVLCDIGAAWNVHLSATDIIWEEARKGSMGKSLRRLAR